MSNPECDGCGITAEDLPYEDLGLSREEAAEYMFEAIGSRILCRSCL
jgi:hypothetical protein